MISIGSIYTIISTKVSKLRFFIVDFDKLNQRDKLNQQNKLNQRELNQLRNIIDSVNPVTELVEGTFNELVEGTINELVEVTT